MSYRLSLRRGPFAPAPLPEAEQTISLIGPFVVENDTAGIEVDRVQFGPVLAEETVILDIIIAGVIPFVEGADTADLTLGVVYEDDSAADLGTWDVSPDGSLIATIRHVAALFPASPTPAGTMRLAAFLEHTGNLSTNGDAAIYALTAVPAA